MVFQNLSPMRKYNLLQRNKKKIDYFPLSNSVSSSLFSRTEVKIQPNKSTSKFYPRAENEQLRSKAKEN